MKKLFALLLALSCLLAITACGEDDTATKKPKDKAVIGETVKESKAETTDDSKTTEEVEEDTSTEAEENPSEVEDEEEDGKSSASKKKTETKKRPKVETVTLINSAKGTATENDSPDTYAFTLESSGKINISVKSSSVESLELTIYDADNQQVWRDYARWNSTTKQISFIKDLELVSGAYTLSASRNYGLGDFEVSVDFTSASESFTENISNTNNLFENASAIETDEVYFGQLAHNDIIDNYIFTLDEAGTLDLVFKGQGPEGCYIKIYDADGLEIWNDYVTWNSTSKQISFKDSLPFTAGTYYCSVSANYGYGNYDICFNYTSAKETFSEEQNGSDNEFDVANEIELKKKYTGQLAVNDSIDMYSFEVSNSNGITIDLSAKGVENFILTVYDEDGFEVWSDYVYWNSTSKQLSSKSDIDLESGIYYLSVSKGYSGTYNFTIKSR